MLSVSPMVYHLAPHTQAFNFICTGTVYEFPLKLLSFSPGFKSHTWPFCAFTEPVDRLLNMGLAIYSKGAPLIWEKWEGDSLWAERGWESDVDSSANAITFHPVITSSLLSAHMCISKSRITIAVCGAIWRVNEARNRKHSAQRKSYQQ